MKKADKKELLEKMELLLQTELNPTERAILLDHHSKLERAKEIEFELVKLRNALLPLVISSQLSQSVLNFYKEIRAERKISWGEGSSLITGISEFPKKS